MVKIVNISKRKFENLSPLVLSKGIMNTEGDLYLINLNGDDFVFKKLYHQDDDVYSNKLYTVSMLNNYKDYFMGELCIPQSLVSVDSNVVGFLMPYIKGNNLNTILNDLKIPTKEKISYLKQIGSLLEKLDGLRKYSPVNDFYLNDLHDSNFLVDTEKNVHVIDLDSAKIGNNKPSPSRFLSSSSLIKYAPMKYKIDMESELCKPSVNTDLYCYNAMILNYLYGSSSIITSDLDNFYKYLNYLEDIHVDKNIIDSFSKLIVNTMNVNPCEYLDNLTSENVVRANEKVYKRVVR